MTEEEKWKLVNQAETLEELQKAIGMIDAAGPISGSQKTWEVNRLRHNVKLIIENGYPARIATRAYGIRQQALYIVHYEQLEKLYDGNQKDLLCKSGNSGAVGSGEVVPE